MAITDVHGTQTATITTEHTLADTSAAGIYVLTVDLNDLSAGDVLELRIYKMVLAGGTRRVVFNVTYRDLQHEGKRIAVSVPVSTALSDSGAIRATLKQTAGSAGRSFPWSLEKFA